MRVRLLLLLLHPVFCMDGCPGRYEILCGDKCADICRCDDENVGKFSEWCCSSGPCTSSENPMFGISSYAMAEPTVGTPVTSPGAKIHRGLRRIVLTTTMTLYSPGAMLPWAFPDNVMIGERMTISCV